MEDSDVILQAKDVKLTVDQFIYQGTAYPISKIKAASLKEGNYRNPDKLQIQFKNGATKEFYFRPTVTFKEMVAERLSTHTITPWRTIQNKIAIQILEWATTINELINKESP